MLKQPGHFTSMKNELGVCTNRFSLCRLASTDGSGCSRSISYGDWVGCRTHKKHIELARSQRCAQSSRMPPSAAQLPGPNHADSAPLGQRPTKTLIPPGAAARRLREERDGGGVARPEQPAGAAACSAPHPPLGAPTPQTPTPRSPSPPPSPRSPHAREHAACRRTIAAPVPCASRALVRLDGDRRIADPNEPSRREDEYQLFIHTHPPPAADAAIVRIGIVLGFPAISAASRATVAAVAIRKRSCIGFLGCPKHLHSRGFGHEHFVFLCVHTALSNLVWGTD